MIWKTITTQKDFVMKGRTIWIAVIKAEILMGGPLFLECHSKINITLEDFFLTAAMKMTGDNRLEW